MGLWMVRAFPGNIDRMVNFLEMDIIAVHWGIGDLSGCHSKEDVSKVVAQAELEPRDASLKTGLLNRFVNKMQIGDYCIVPYGDHFYVGIIKSEYYYDPQSLKYEHQREVEWLNLEMPSLKAYGRREDLPEAIQASLKTQLGLADFSQHEQIFTEYLSQQEKGAEVTTEKPKETSEFDSLLKNALKILQEEMQSDDPNRRLRAAVAIVGLK